MCVIQGSVFEPLFSASLPDLTFRRAGFRDASSFNNFVLRVLSRRYNNLPLTKFSFAHYGKDKSIISKAIKYAVTHNVQDLNLVVVRASFEHLSPYLHNCRSMKTLTFYNVLHLQALTLPCLTSLSLYSCRFRDADPFVGLVSLKSLQLYSCDTYYIKNFKISGPQLDSLTIRNVTTDYKVYDDEDGRKVEIFAPKLRFFSFLDCDLLNIVFSNLDFPLLEMADIDTSRPAWHFTSLRIRNQCFKASILHVINVFRGFNHVESLVLSALIIKGLMKFPRLLEDQASPFVRLKTLKVKYDPDSGSSFSTLPDNVMNFFGGNVTVEKICETQKKKGGRNI